MATDAVLSRMRAGPSARGPGPIDVFVCGSTERSDQGAPTAAARLFEPVAPTCVRVRRLERLEVDDLLLARGAAGLVVVDTSTGIEPGTIVELPLRGMADGRAALRPSIAHVLTLPEVLGVVDMLRGRPLPGRVVLIGARRFTRHRPITRRVRQAVPALSRAIALAVERVRLEA